MSYELYRYEPNPDYPKLLNEFFEFLVDEEDKSKNTIEKYGENLMKFIQYIRIKKGWTKIKDYEKLNEVDIRRFTEKEMTQITLQDIREYMKYYKQVKRNSKRTLNNKRASLETFYRWLIDEKKLVDINLAKSIKIEKIRKEQQMNIDDCLTEEETKLLLNTIKNSNKKYVTRDFCMFVIMCFTGVRRDEIINVKISKIDFKHSTITITGKGNKERELDLKPELIDIIKNYLEVRKKLFTKIKESDKDMLFLSQRGAKLSGGMVNKTLKEYAKMAGLEYEEIHPHTLRHTAATMMVQNTGGDIVSAGKALGHTDIKTTQLYTHVSKQQRKKAFDSIDLL